MLFRDGKPDRAASPTSAALTPEMLKALIDGVSAKVSENLRGGHAGAPGAGAGVGHEFDSVETLQRLAEAMTKSAKPEEKNFDNLGEVKKVESNSGKNKKTLEMLKDIK